MNRGKMNSGKSSVAISRNVNRLAVRRMRSRFTGIRGTGIGRAMQKRGMVILGSTPGGSAGGKRGDVTRGSIIPPFHSKVY